LTPEDKLLWERAFDKFDHMEEKIDTNHKNQNEKISDLCDRATKTETALSIHLAAQEKRAIRKEKAFYIIIALIGVSIGVFEYVK